MIRPDVLLETVVAYPDPAELDRILRNVEPAIKKLMTTRAAQTEDQFGAFAKIGSVTTHVHGQPGTGSAVILLNVVSEPREVYYTRLHDNLYNQIVLKPEDAVADVKKRRELLTKLRRHIRRTRKRSPVSEAATTHRYTRSLYFAARTYPIKRDMLSQFGPGEREIASKLLSLSTRIPESYLGEIVVILDFVVNRDVEEPWKDVPQLMTAMHSAVVHEVGHVQRPQIMLGKMARRMGNIRGPHEVKRQKIELKQNQALVKIQYEPWFLLQATHAAKPEELDANMPTIKRTWDLFPEEHKQNLTIRKLLQAADVADIFHTPLVSAVEHEKEYAKAFPHVRGIRKRLISRLWREGIRLPW